VALSALAPWIPLVLAVAPLPSIVPPRAALDLAAIASVEVVAELPAACPNDMLLVDGNFCPSLEYQCDRFVDDTNPSCAEYARKPECRFNETSERFCVDRYEWPNKVGEKPTVFMTWYDARRACRDEGKHLCKRAEWTLACEGPKRAPFPYGWERFPSPCNVSRPVDEADNKRLSNPNTRQAEIARLWQADPIGSHPDCISPFGAIDMVGNVDEWTDNSDEGGELVSTLNGGYWGPVRNTCRLTTKTHGPEFQFYQIGFRCCSDPLDGLGPADPPDPISKTDLEGRKGPEGWPVPVSEDGRGPKRASEPSG
jgi:hypothetical protein